MTDELVIHRITVKSGQPEPYKDTEAVYKYWAHHSEPVIHGGTFLHTDVLRSMVERLHPYGRGRDNRHPFDTYIDYIEQDESDHTVTIRVVTPFTD